MQKDFMALTDDEIRAAFSHAKSIQDFKYKVHVRYSSDPKYFTERLKRLGLNKQDINQSSVYSNQDILDNFDKATSFNDLGRRLGLKQAGGSLTLLVKRCEALGLDSEGLKNQGWRRGKKFSPRPMYSDEEVFCNPSNYKGGSQLKKRALQSGFVSNKCAICGQGPEWNGKPLVLILDHIDGNRVNNLPTNLRMVCPNCDIQLPTSRGKNARLKPKSVSEQGRWDHPHHECLITF